MGAAATRWSPALEVGAVAPGVLSLARSLLARNYGADDTVAIPVTLTKARLVLLATDAVPTVPVGEVATRLTADEAMAWRL